MQVNCAKKKESYCLQELSTTVVGHRLCSEIFMLKDVFPTAPVSESSKLDSGAHFLLMSLAMQAVREAGGFTPK